MQNKRGFTVNAKRLCYGLNITLAESLFILHLNKLPAIEAAEVLAIVNIAELVADNMGIAEVASILACECPKIHASIRLSAIKSPNSVAKALFSRLLLCSGATTTLVGR